MIDRKLLTQNIISFVLVGLLALSFEHKLAAALLLLPSILMSIVLFSMRRQTLKIRIRGLFEDHTAIADLQEQLARDPEMFHVIEYLYSLPPAEFFKIGRLVTEMRNAGNQRWYADIVAQFLKEKE